MPPVTRPPRPARPQPAAPAPALTTTEFLAALAMAGLILTPFLRTGPGPRDPAGRCRAGFAGRCGADDAPGAPGTSSASRPRHTGPDASTLTGLGTEDLDITLTDASTADITTHRHLAARATAASSHLSYHGHPQIMEDTTSGASTIRPAP